MAAFGKCGPGYVGLSAVEVAHVPQRKLCAIRGTHAVSHKTQAGSVSGNWEEERGGSHASQERLEELAE